jgi:hypothetical protein
MNDKRLRLAIATTGLALAAVASLSVQPADNDAKACATCNWAYSGGHTYASCLPMGEYYTCVTDGESCSVNMQGCHS